MAQTRAVRGGLVVPSDSTTIVQGTVVWGTTCGTDHHAGMSVGHSPGLTPKALTAAPWTFGGERTQRTTRLLLHEKAGPGKEKSTIR